MNETIIWKKRYVAMGIAAFIAIVIFNIIESYCQIGNNNLIEYVIFCVSFIFSFAGINALLSLKRLNNNVIVINTACVMLSVGMILVMYVCYLKDVLVARGTAELFLWHKYSPFLVITILMIISYIFKSSLFNVTLSKCSSILFYILIILLGGYLNYYLEYLSQDYWHGSAVFNSVYNVLHGVPYDEIANCIYGNYAIVLALPMKIFGGGEYFDFSRIMCGLTMVCILFAIYVICSLVKTHMLRILCSVSLLWPFIFGEGNYWQVYPLRIVGPMFLLTWVCFCHSMKLHLTKKNISFLGAYFILMFAILWNKETGIVCLLAYVVFYLFENVNVFEPKKREVLSGFFHVIILFSSFFAAFIGVGIYNFIVARKWISWKAFLFPLLSDNYMTGLKIDLEGGIWPWMLNALLFLGVMGICIIKKYDRKEKDEWNIYIMVSLLGLGLMCYFMNRAAYFNMTICYYEAIICIGIIASRLSDDNNVFAKFISGISLMVLVALMLGETLQLGPRLYNKEEKDISQEKILRLRDDIILDAESDTYALGVNIPELYSILGWNKRNYTTDWADVSIESSDIVKKIYEDLENENSVITDKALFDRANQQSIYEYLDEYFYVDKVYTYWYNEEVEFYLWKRKNAKT